MTHNFFYIYLFRFSTCFEQPCAHQQESQMYQYNIWYMLLRVGDRAVRIVTIESSTLNVRSPYCV